ncbi:GIY-YIG nuclease family protein [Zafaria sp. Z1313]|uniref:GIY-YIG nuclease family protein n=1 Tax=Zafaria sp. Z1313 TaxID=3423202 RepID=UPI003D302FAC
MDDVLKRNEARLLDDFVTDVVDGLLLDPKPITQADRAGLNQPGIYAIWAQPSAWQELGIDFRPGVPLYVGKAERSIASRDLVDHFAIDSSRKARTGSSTVRRSFAALFRSQLRLRAIPRNPGKPDGSANFGLAPDADERLSIWMKDTLALSAWLKPHGIQTSLAEIEANLIRHFEPPLNLTSNPNPHPALAAARAVMAAEARVWKSSESR